MTDWAGLVARMEGGPVSVGSMFGSRGLRTGSKFFAIWWHDRLVLKLPADRREGPRLRRARGPVRADGGAAHERLGRRRRGGGLAAAGRRRPRPPGGPGPAARPPRRPPHPP